MTSAAPDTAPTPEVAEASLIVCSRNRPALLEEVVCSVLDGEAVPAELIVVDQSDVRNETLASMGNQRGCEVRYVWPRTIGLSRANNTGAAAARYDRLVFTHDDVVVTPTWLGALVRALAQFGPRAVVTGRVLAAAPESAGAFAPSTNAEEAPAVYEGRATGEVLHPMSLALHRQALEDAGGFDERLGPGTPFPGGEDHDLEFRLREAGYRLHYVPEAVLYHRAWRSEDEYLPLRWRYGLGQGAFYAKHFHWHDRYMLGRLRGDLIHRAGRFARRFRRQRRLALGDARFIAGLLVGITRWMALHGLPRPSRPRSGPRTRAPAAEPAAPRRAA